MTRHHSCFLPIASYPIPLPPCLGSGGACWQPFSTGGPMGREHLMDPINLCKPQWLVQYVLFTICSSSRVTERARGTMSVLLGLWKCQAAV
ncbi:hypothetical protein BaRGS_00001740 [Batillaria attramentaria]|uniref:Uncharacterized protein n=1 Tax=Batillaria attramentaria TaxID=370345 RepID=A0ABD0M652_9CAEN